MVAARERIGEMLAAAHAIAEELPRAGARSDECGPDNLAWMCRTAREGLDTYPVDKLSRWLGFVHAGLEAAGANLPPARPLPGPAAEGPLLEAHHILFGRYAAIAGTAGLPPDAGRAGVAETSALPAAELSYRLGRIQGILACRGLVSVREEREVSRPLFHAAYRRDGVIPPTLEGPGSARP